MNVTRITIGRLFSTGNYEHVRYEISVDLHPGDSAATAMIGLEKILEGLNPKRTVKTWDDIKRAERRMVEIRAMTDEEFTRQHGYAYKGTRAEYEDRMAVGIVEDKLELEKWEKRHAKARRLLDSLAGAEKWKDAKLDWERFDNWDDDWG